MKEENKSAVEKIIFYFSLFAFCFMCFFFLNNYYLQSRAIILGVIHELFMIPCIFSSPVLLLLAVRGFYLSGFKVKSYYFVSLILSFLTLSSIVTLAILDFNR